MYNVQCTMYTCEQAKFLTKSEGEGQDNETKRKCTCMYMYIHAFIVHDVYMYNVYTCFKRDERRKKQARSNKQQGKATQHTQGSHLHVPLADPTISRSTGEEFMTS